MDKREEKENCDGRDQTADSELGSLQNTVEQMISGRYPLLNCSYHADAHLDFGKEEGKASTDSESTRKRRDERKRIGRDDLAPISSLPEHPSSHQVESNETRRRLSSIE